MFKSSLLPFYVRVPVFTRSLSYILNRNQKIGIAQWVMLNSGPLKTAEAFRKSPSFRVAFCSLYLYFHIFHIEFRACDVDRIFHWNLTLWSWQFSSKLTPFSGGLEDGWKVCLWLLLIYYGGMIGSSFIYCFSSLMHGMKWRCSALRSILRFTSRLHWLVVGISRLCSLFYFLCEYTETD